MMIVDLVDEHDFNEKLIALGVDITPDTALADSQTAVLQWIADNDSAKASLQTLFSTLENSEITVLPEVKAAIAALSSAVE